MPAADVNVEILLQHRKMPALVGDLRQEMAEPLRRLADPVKSEHLVAGKQRVPVLRPRAGRKARESLRRNEQVRSSGRRA